MKSFKLIALTRQGELALDRVLTGRDIEKIIPYALKKAGAKIDIDYKMEVEE